MTAIGQSNLLQALGWAVFNSLWQMAILWVAYQLIVSVLRINKSSLKSLLSAALLFSGFTWFIFTFITAFANTAGTSNDYAGLMNIRAGEDMNNWLNTMLPLTSVLYLLLLVLPVLNFIRNYRYVQVIRRFGLSRADVHCRMFIQKTAAQLGIRKNVHIWMSDLISSPVTIGYIKPIILLPLAAVSHLNTQQIEAVLLHELAHIRRYDYFINFFVKLIQTVLYFNPFVKAFASIIEREREKSCDETVMQFQYEPHGYASALLALEKAAHVSRHSLTLAASDGKKTEFRQRIEWILGINKKPVFSFNKLAGVMLALFCFIALNAFLLISNPPKNEPGEDSMSLLTSPYDFLNSSGYDKLANVEPAIEDPIIENQTVPLVNKAAPVEEEPLVAPPASKEEIIAASPETENIPAPLFNFVYHLENIIPSLNAIKEKQVQEALVESKRVIQEISWKEVEKNIADAMTKVEKEQVKEEYKKAVNNIDWEKMGDRLRLAYDKIDWTRINAELDQALAVIKIDSLEQVYSIAFNNLTELQTELVKHKQPGIPDSDVTVKSIEVQKVEIQKAINKLKRTRPRKIVHL